MLSKIQVERCESRYKLLANNSQESGWMCAKSLDRNSYVPMREDLNSQWKLSGFWPFYTLSTLADFFKRGF